MNSLFDFVFNQDEYAFPIQKLMEFKKKSNEDLVVLIYRQAMWLSFAQGLVLTRKDTRGTRMMYLIDR